ncbi:MAG: M48 family metallopeptidase [Eikenella sp.]|nr:M48 family metallopeptidase [Eikenella sp.]
MCQHSCSHHSPAELVKKSRHRFEWPLFALTAFLTVCAFVIALSVSVYKQETLGVLKETAVTEYRAANAGAEKLSDTEVLAKLSDDEKEAIDAVEGLETPLVLLAPLALLLMIIYQIGKHYGTARGDGIRVTPDQFGEVHAMWTEMAQKLGMKKIPELYIQNGNGALNAFATCLPGYRAFGVIYSDILERALANGDEKSLRFILGHELGHIRLGHVSWWYLILGIIGNLPGINYFVGLPLSRAREYGCDKVGHALSGDSECRGLLMLASGKHLYRKVDLDAYEAEQVHARSFWATVHNFFIDHPVINWRIAALRQQRHGDLLIPKKYRR